MSRKLTLLTVVLLAGAALAGCTGNDAPPTTTSPATNTTTMPASTTPASTPVPNITSPSVPTITTPGTTPPNVANASVDRVYVISSPEKAGNGTSPQVCWRVEGNGTITHTALHWGTTSNPNGSFSDYPNPVYPDNGPAVGQHKLPGAFCATIGPVNATIYYKAHAMVTPAESELSTEEIIIAGSGNQTADLLGAPEVFPGGLSYNLCWEIPGTSGTSPHTAVHFDTTSHPNATGIAEYPDAAYPNNTAATTSGSFELPGPFCADVTIPQNGTLYVRAHAIVNGTSFLGPERSIVAAPRVAVSGGIPQSAPAGSVVEICWRAESSGTSTHTAFHWDTTSHPTSTAVTDYPNAVYPDNGPATTTGSFELPGPFCGDLTMPQSGTVYFRPHVVYPAPGGQELGPEYAIRVG